jgi:hypothetical protein
MAAKKIAFNDPTVPPSYYDEGIPGRKRKKRGTSGDVKKRAKEAIKLTTEYEQELDKLSDLTMDGVTTNLDLLKTLRKLLIATLATARGAFKAKPCPSNVYALTRLVSDIQNLTKAIEDACDYSELSNVVFEEVLKPFLDRSLLDLGSHIKDSLEKHAGDDEKKYKKLERVMTEAYRRYGASLEGKIPNMQAKLKKSIIKFSS